ncbi:EAL domain-containing protein [Massilia sp. GCM10020059]|uniref:EAL domain-containing protein n=1 Tax=Massilia agrisoli TaxID=2892444 RepID=A0ABS8IR60_9BURK|nr:EAL domain-containing protein [Massilia agrisoli]MCC6070896.1 EAL domain-containing protein [Massilia agrisoli]
MPERCLASVLSQHESAELFRLMVAGIRECGVMMLDPEGTITTWNQAAQEMTGYASEQAIGAGYALVYTDDDRQQQLPGHDLDLAARTGFVGNEVWRRRRDGSLFWAHTSLTALRDAGGALLGYSATLVDMTHLCRLKQCERERQEIELILGAAWCGIWKWDIGRDEVTVSRHLRELLGYDSGERTLRFADWMLCVLEDDRRRIEAQLTALRDKPALAPLDTELRCRTREGPARWFFLRANWEHDVDGRGPVLVGACVDIDNRKQAENEKMRLYHQLRQERARFANILEQLPSGVILAEAPSGKLIYQNRAGEAMLGRGIDGVASTEDYGSYVLYDAKGRRMRTEDLPLTQSIREGRPVVQELQYDRGDGKRVHFAVTTALIADPDGSARTAVAVMQDVTELKQAQLCAATEKERALVTLAAITDGVVTLGRDGLVTSVNPSAERLLGRTEAAAVGHPVADVLSVDEPGGEQAIQDAVMQCQQERRPIPGLPHLTAHGRDGRRFSIDNAVAPVTLADGELIGAVLVMHDVTESKRLVRKLGFEASHDSLTGLFNRREFEQRLQRALDHSRQDGSAGSALLYLDLDQFKIVNDTCGHSAGDDLLRLLAQSYVSHVRERDTLARIGGDEFALIVEHCDVDEALGVAYKLLDATRNLRYACKGRMFQLGVSIGITPIDTGTATVEEALRRADHACYIAKERGRNRAYVHDTSDHDFAQRRSDMHWVTRLAHAFDHDQLQLYRQPIVPISDAGGAARHYEILLRLGTGQGAPIGPASFLPAAERYDLILKIDRWVLMRTLDWMSNHRDDTEHLDMCSINLSRRSLGDQSFHKFAAELIDRSDVPPHKLCFEITENGAIANMNKTTNFIRTLSARGCRFSLDDFGSGMTSLSYLKELPVDFIKIDGAFIQTMSSSEVDYEMVRFTNEISHMMGRKTIAEYVSDPAILGTLHAIGVDYAQGFWVGKPRPLMA